MEKMNKLSLLCVVMILFIAGCGKKKEVGPKVESPKGSKEMSRTGTPLPKETENLLDDDDISSFAFVDDDKDVAKDVKAQDAAPAPASEAFASNDEDIDTDDAVLPDDENDEASSYAFKNIHFDFNKDHIRADQGPVVEENVRVAHQAVEQGKNVIIEGHCCQLGSAAYNLALSQRRAQAIKEKMMAAGVGQDAIKTVGYGNERPLVWSDASDRKVLIKELAPNRRAETLVN